MPEAALERTARGGTAPAGVRAFLERVFPAPRTFAIRLWDGTEIPAEREAAFTLVLRHPGSLRRMFRPPVELSMGEAYLRRDFDVEGDLVAAFDLTHRARGAFASPASAGALLRAYLRLPRGTAGETEALPTRGPARLEGAPHTLERDRDAVRYHYDVGNDFYRLFLDRRMIYSCAYYPAGAETLDEAQERKLELLCRKLRLRPGERLLDIGCGWGGLAIHAAERHGVRVLGVTLSDAQLGEARARVAAAGLADRVRIERRDYREVRSERFEKIVSVGMFEHVGRARFSDYFGRAFRLLEPGGLFLNHAISSHPARYESRPPSPAARALSRALVGHYAFRRRYIFPDGELLPVSEANLAAERAGFEVRDVENLREHYARTVRDWLERLRARRAEAVAIAGEPVYRVWEMYLAGSAFHFDTARIGLHQTLLAKPDGGYVPLPPSRADLYA